MAVLDFSVDKQDVANGTVGSHDLQSLVDRTSLGTRTRDGLYEVKDWEFAKKEDDNDDANDFIAQVLSQKDDSAKKAPGSLGALGSIFARLTGSKVLSEEDLMPVLEAMKQHLMKKNVAKNISEKVCEGVGEGLVGKKVGSFQSMCYWSYAPSLILNVHFIRSHQCYSATGIVEFADANFDSQNVNRSLAVYQDQTVLPTSF